jgi:RNA-binding protein
MSDKADQPMQDLKPTVWIGKQGCSETMIEEIVEQLKKRSMIKVKWLQNTEVDPKSVAYQAKATLVEVRGRTMVLARKGKAVPPTSGTPSKLPNKAPTKVTAKAMARAAIRSPEKRSPGASHGSSGKPAARSASRPSTRPAPRAAAKAPASKKPRKSGAMGRAKK